MDNWVINKYLVSEFIKTFFNVILLFCCLGLILNLFEEMHESTLDLFEKCAIDPNDIEALSAYYEVTCDYYMEEFLGLDD